MQPEIHQNIIVVVIAILIFRFLERFTSYQWPDEFERTGSGKPIGKRERWYPGYAETKANAEAERKAQGVRTSFLAPSQGHRTAFAFAKNKKKYCFYFENTIIHQGSTGEACCGRL